MIYSLVSSVSTNYTKLYIIVHDEGTFLARHPCDMKENLQLRDRTVIYKFHGRLLPRSILTC
jgi:hypothetical protein